MATVYRNVLGRRRRRPGRVALATDSANACRTGCLPHHPDRVQDVLAAEHGGPRGACVRVGASEAYVTARADDQTRRTATRRPARRRCPSGGSRVSRRRWPANRRPSSPTAGPNRRPRPGRRGGPPAPTRPGRRPRPSPWSVTTSNVPLSNGSASPGPLTRRSASGSAQRAISSRATAVSVPATSAPRRSAARRNSPTPQPTSSSRCPRAGRARSGRPGAAAGAPPPAAAASPGPGPARGPRSIVVDDHVVLPARSSPGSMLSPGGRTAHRA